MNPAAEILAALVRRGESLATAESLTGGLVGSMLTTVPGSSAGYLGGVISYATRLKSTLAGVDAATLAAVGPVAEESARQMAAGVARICASDWGLATTGVAGPEPQDGHPVGEVYVAVAHRGTQRSWVERLDVTGDRQTIRNVAADRALDLLLRVLEG